MKLQTLTGAAFEKAIPDLARLRIEVFREYPYLYDGSFEYEERYIKRLAAAKHSIIIAASDERGKIVGCETGSALAAHNEELAAAFREWHPDLTKIFYCSESLLLPEWRGRGLGHEFFRLREAHATARGYKYSVFCAVMRPATHSLKPLNYSPLDGFWEKRGYRKLPGVVTAFRWKDIDQPQESEHPMQFWMREPA